MDITMCINRDCPSSKSCYRFTATPNKFRQSYAKFKPEHPNLNKCDYYWKDKRLIKNGEN